PLFARVRSAVRDELGHVELLDGEAAARRAYTDRLTSLRARGALHPRLALGLAQGVRPPARAVGGIARRDDGHPYLVVELLVDHRAEDDVRVRVGSLRHRLGRLV